MQKSTRRQHLASLVATLGASGLSYGSTTAAPTTSTPWQSAFSLYGMRSLPLGDALQVVHDVGYDAVELAVMKDWPASPENLDADQRKQLHETLKKLSLTVCCLMENLPLDTSEVEWVKQGDRLRRAIELGHELCSEKPPLVETILGGKPDAWPENRPQFERRLRQWAGIAEKSKAIIAIKPHRFGSVHTPGRLLELLQAVPSPAIRATFDFSHFFGRGWSLAETLQAIRPWLAFIHIKDTILDHGQPRFVLPGEGGIDYPAYGRLLADVRYHGAVCVEVSAMVQKPATYDPIGAASKSFQAVLKMRGQR